MSKQNNNYTYIGGELEAKLSIRYVKLLTGDYLRNNKQTC